MTALRPLDPDVLVAHADAVRRLARALVADAVEAEDVAQEALATGLEHSPRPGWSPRAWLAGVVRNVARSRARARRRRALREAAAARPEAVGSTLDVAARLSEQRAVVAAVHALREPYRTVVTLRWFDGLPPRAVAARLGVPVETARTQAKRGLRYLRAALTERHAGDERRALVLLAPLSAGRRGPWGLLGGSIMATKTATTAAAVLLVLAAGVAGWFALHRERASTPDAARGAETEAAAGPALEGHGSQAPPLPPEPPGTGAEGVVRGRVESLDGRPLPGARVVLQDADRIGSLEGAPAVLAGPDGAFRLHVPPALGSRVRLAVSAADHFPEASAVAPGAAGLLVVRLAPRVHVALRVLDAVSDRPVPGAVAEVSWVRDGSEWRERGETDAEGLVSVAAPSGARVGLMDLPSTLRVSRPGYETSRRTPWAASGGAATRPIDVYLRRGEAARVRVVAEDGRTPVAGARVRGWSGNAAPLGVGADYRVSEVALSPLGDATTDAEGLATLGTPTAGEQVFLLVESAGRAGVRCLADAGAAAPKPWAVALRRVVELRGRVLDEAGAPVEGAVVETNWREWLVRADRVERADALPMLFPPPAWHDRVTGRTGSDGTFEIPWLAFPAGGKMQVWALASGSGVASEDVPEPAAGVEAVEVVLRLTAGPAAWSVRVTDREGRPIVGAVVGQAQTYPMARTKSDGTARIHVRAAPGERPLVLGSAPGFATARVVPDESARERTLELVLGPARPLLVETQDAGGAPVAASIEVYAGEVPAAEVLPSQVWWDERRVARGTTGADGVLRFADLPQGPLVVWAGVASEVGSARASVGAEERVVVRLPGALPAGRSMVEGSVLDGDGAAVLRYRISMEARGIVALPSLDGVRFRFDDVLPGDYDLLVTPLGSTTRTIVAVHVEPGRDVRGLVVRLGEESSIEGTVRPPAGRSLPPLRAVAMALGGVRPWGTSAEVEDDGTFALRGLAPGRYAVRVVARGPGAAAPGLQLTSAEVTLGPRERLVRDFEAAPAARLYLRSPDERLAESAAGARPPNFATDPRERASGEVVVTLTDAAGARQSTGGLYRTATATPFLLLPGTYRLEASHPRWGRFSTELDVRGSGDVTALVRLELPPR